MQHSYFTFLSALCLLLAFAMAAPGPSPLKPAPKDDSNNAISGPPWFCPLTTAPVDCHSEPNSWSKVLHQWGLDEWPQFECYVEGEEIEAADGKKTKYWDYNKEFNCYTSEAYVQDWCDVLITKECERGNPAKEKRAPGPSPLKPAPKEPAPKDDKNNGPPWFCPLVTDPILPVPIPCRAKPDGSSDVIHWWNPFEWPQFDCYVEGTPDRGTSYWDYNKEFKCYTSEADVQDWCDVLITKLCQRGAKEKRAPEAEAEAELEE